MRVIQVTTPGVSNEQYMSEDPEGSWQFYEQIMGNEQISYQGLWFPVRGLWVKQVRGWVWYRYL